MPAEKGSAFLLKVGDGGLPPVYATVAGLRTTQLSINGDAVVITNKGSGAWRELLSGAGVRSVSVSGAGVFTGSTAEARIKSSALSGVLDDYELSFESGDRMRGKFLVARLDYAGDFNGERRADGALALYWIRRSRFDPGWADFAEQPVGEERLEFDVKISSGGSTLYSAVVAESSTEVSTAIIEAWNLPSGATVELQVMQLGQFAISRPATHSFQV